MRKRPWRRVKEKNTKKEKGHTEAVIDKGPHKLADVVRDTGRKG